jgi:hypothetical protein
LPSKANVGGLFLFLSPLTYSLTEWTEKEYLITHLYNSNMEVKKRLLSPKDESLRKLVGLSCRNVEIFGEDYPESETVSCDENQLMASYFWQNVYG